MKKIKFLNKSTVAIIILLYIFCASFPFCLFINDTLICQLSTCLLTLVYLVSLVIYLRFNKNIKIDTFKINIKNLIFLIPLLLMSCSNFFYLLTVNNNFVYSYSFPLTIVTTIFIVLTEEIIFRGIVISNIKNSKEIKILLSSLLFAICHISRFLSTLNPLDLTSIIYSFVLGLICSSIYIYGGSLTAATIFHLSFNIINQNLFSLFIITEMNYLYYFLINISIGGIVLIYLLIIYHFRLKKISN